MAKARNPMESRLNERIAKSVADLAGSEEVESLVREALAAGIQARDIIENGLRKGIDIVGKKYEAGEYFLSELIFAGKLMNDALEILKPHLGSYDSDDRAIIVLGTVKGDIHDIGKNIFGMLAAASGFEVRFRCGCETRKLCRSVESNESNDLGALLASNYNDARNEKRVKAHALAENSESIVRRECSNEGFRT